MTHLAINGNFSARYEYSGAAIIGHLLKLLIKNYMVSESNPFLVYQSRVISKPGRSERNDLGNSRSSYFLIP